jgi:hypothetical protein
MNGLGVFFFLSKSQKNWIKKKNIERSYEKMKRTEFTWHNFSGLGELLNNIWIKDGVTHNLLLIIFFFIYSIPK